MIIIGYQGIGKSTLSQSYNGFIDLESSLFKHENGTRSSDWAKIYCKVAESLSEQKYWVLVSSHGSVQVELSKSEERVIAIYPSIDIKDEWVKKLKNRWDETKEEKDYAAYIGAAMNYESEIEVLNRSPFDKIIIRNVYYDLPNMIIDHFAVKEGKEVRKDDG